MNPIGRSGGGSLLLAAAAVAIVLLASPPPVSGQVKLLPILDNDNCSSSSSSSSSSSFFTKPTGCHSHGSRSASSGHTSSNHFSFSSSSSSSPSPPSSRGTGGGYRPLYPCDDKHCVDCQRNNGPTGRPSIYDRCRRCEPGYEPHWTGMSCQRAASPACIWHDNCQPRCEHGCSVCHFVYFCGTPGGFGRDDSSYPPSSNKYRTTSSGKDPDQEGDEGEWLAWRSLHFAGLLLLPCVMVIVLRAMNKRQAAAASSGAATQEVLLESGVRRFTVRSAAPLSAGAGDGDDEDESEGAPLMGGGRARASNSVLVVGPTGDLEMGVEEEGKSGNDADDGDDGEGLEEDVQERGD